MVQNNVNRIIFCDAWKVHGVQCLHRKCPETSKTQYLCVVYGCFHATSELNVTAKTLGGQNLKYLLSGLLQKEFANPCHQNMFPFLCITHLLSNLVSPEGQKSCPPYYCPSPSSWRTHKLCQIYCSIDWTVNNCLLGILLVRQIQRYIISWLHL